MTPGEEPHYRSRVLEKVQLPVDIPDLIPGDLCRSEEGDNISCGVLQLRVVRQCMQDAALGTYQNIRGFGRRSPTILYSIGRVEDPCALIVR